MKECKTRIKVTNKYKGGKLISTTYLPEYQMKLLPFKWWQPMDTHYGALEYLEVQDCSPKYVNVWECKEWVESFVIWWREKNFAEETLEIDYYDWPED